MKRNLEILVILIFVTSCSFAQKNLLKNQAYDSIPNHRKMNSVLVDSKTKTRFILDSKRKSVSAVKKSGKLLWRTTPQENGEIDTPFDRNNKIAYFYFDFNESTKKEEIVIVYANTATGIIDKKTGKFIFGGRD